MYLPPGCPISFLQKDPIQIANSQSRNNYASQAMGGVIFFQFRPGRGVDLIIQTCPIKRRHHVMITRADVFPRAKASLSSFFCFFGKVVHLCVHLSPEQFGRQEIVHPRRVWLMRLMNLGARRPAEDDGGRPRAEKLLTSAVSLSFYCCCQRFSP